jgi:phosphoribosyl-ATP pyrophosphohydrolase
MPEQTGKKKRPKPPDRRSEPSNRLEQLQADIGLVRSDPERAPRVARLIAAGIPKMAKKVAEEGAEIAIDAVRQDRSAVVNETVDLFYNLAVLLDELGIRMGDVWAEMDRRRSLYGIAEKLPKTKRVAVRRESRDPASAFEAEPLAERPA